MPRHVQQMFWKQGTEQLYQAVDGVPAGRNTHPGPDGNITWDSKT